MFLLKVLMKILDFHIRDLFDSHSSCLYKRKVYGDHTSRRSVIFGKISRTWAIYFGFFFIIRILQQMCIKDGLNAWIFMVLNTRGISSTPETSCSSRAVFTCPPQGWVISPLLGFPAVNEILLKLGVHNIKDLLLVLILNT